MGVDYTPICVYGVELTEEMFEELTHDYCVAYAAERLDSRASEYYGGDRVAATEDLIDEARGEAKYEWSHKGVKIKEAGAASYGGDPTYYLGVPLKDLRDPAEVKAFWEEAAKDLNIKEAPAFHLDLRIW